MAAIWKLVEEEDSDAAISGQCLLKLRLTGSAGSLLLMQHSAHNRQPSSTSCRWIWL